MRLTHRLPFLSAAFLLTVALSIATAQTLTANKTGSQGGYIYEFWKDNGGSGTMILGDGGDFSCTWSGINNILFRKGLRPGVKNQTITFSATYNPSGNSYLSVYGWTKNPLVEYYIIESWGNWRPPGGSVKKTITVSGDKYDIYQTTRTNQPSIEGTKTFQQYWSVRQAKRTSGTIYCSEHFNAWADLGMTMGSMYEVSFVVEGYQSNGNADVKMSMTSGYPAGVVSGNNPSALSGATASIMHKRIEVTGSGNQTIDFTIPENRFGSLNLYNVLGQEIAPARKREFPAGRHTVSFSDFNLSRGTYVYSVKQSR